MALGMWLPSSLKRFAGLRLCDDTSAHVCVSQVRTAYLQGAGQVDLLWKLRCASSYRSFAWLNEFDRADVDPVVGLVDTRHHSLLIKLTYIHLNLQTAFHVYY